MKIYIKWAKKGQKAAATPHVAHSNEDAQAIIEKIVADGDMVLGVDREDGGVVEHLLALFEQAREG